MANGTLKQLCHVEKHTYDRTVDGSGRVSIPHPITTNNLVVVPTGNYLIRGIRKDVNHDSLSLVYLTDNNDAPLPQGTEVSLQVTYIVGGGKRQFASGSVAGCAA